MPFENIDINNSSINSNYSNNHNNNNNNNNIKNVIDLSLNQNKYLIEPDKGCLFTIQTTFKNIYSQQLSHVITEREYCKSIEQLNSTIEPLLSSFRLNNCLFLFLVLLFPSLIVTSIFAAMGKIFLASIIVAGVSMLILIFAIIRKSFLHKRIAKGIAKDISDFNKRYSSRQVILEYLVTTKFNYKNGVEHSISLHLIYPIITITPGMFRQQQQEQQQKPNDYNDGEYDDLDNTHEKSRFL